MDSETEPANSEPKPAKLRSKQRTRKASKQRTQSQKRNMEHRGSASQNTEKARCNVLPLKPGGASPSLEVKAMEWHNFAEILFGLAAVITALKQGAKKK